MDKKVHRCKQIQFTGIFQGISLFIIIEQRQGKKDSWRFFVT